MFTLEPCVIIDQVVHRYDKSVFCFNNITIKIIQHFNIISVEINILHYNLL